MQFHINPGAELPIYRQIMRQVGDAIAGGRLVAGDQMPSQRELAQRLVIAPLTVKKAYDELEHQGLIETRRGRGTFVRAAPSAADLEAQRRRLQSSVRRLLTEAYLGNVPLEEVLALLHQTDAELRAERARRSGAKAPTLEQEVSS